MKKTFMKKKLGTLLLLLCTISVFGLPVHASAMSKANQKAHTAFQTQLKKDKAAYCSSFMPKLKYAYQDIDGDKVDELITSPGYGYCSQIIYDYKKGKVKQVAVVSQGEFTKYYAKKKVITVKNSGHMGYLYDYYYKWSGNTYKLVAKEMREYGSRSYEEAPISTTYYMNGNETTKSKYKAYVKKLTKNGGRKFSKIKWKTY